jgi:hypothetical protein
VVSVEPDREAPPLNTVTITRRILRGVFAVPMIVSGAMLLFMPSPTTLLTLFWMVVLFTPALIWPQVFALLYGKGMIMLSVLGLILPSQMRDPFETAGRTALENTFNVGTYYIAILLIGLLGVALLVSHRVVPLLRSLNLVR